MILIPCPWCGPRDHTEFTYGADGTLTRPAPEAADSAWMAYVYLRDNPKGPHTELWLHSGGCRRWLRVERDTVTHRVRGAAFATQTPGVKR